MRRRVVPFLLVLAASCGSGEPSPTAVDVTVPTTSSAPDGSTSTSTSTSMSTSTSSPTTAGGDLPAEIGEAPGTAIGPPVWTGRDLVVWSGAADGNADDEGYAWRGRWRRIAHSPLRPRSSHTAVWTGTEVLYWGGQAGHRDLLGDGAAYDPVADRWRTLSRSPLGPRAGHVAVWTGREMVVWGGYDECCPIDSILHERTAAAYDPATDRWRRLPDVPEPWSGDDGPAVVAGDDGHMYVWRRGHLGVFDVATGTWADRGGPPARSSDNCAVTGGPVADGAFGGRRLVVWTGGCRGTHGDAYDLRTGQWSTLPDAPEPGLSTVLSTPTAFAVSAGTSPALLRLDGSRWVTVDSSGRYGARAFMAWTGRQVVVWGGYRDSRSLRTGIVHRP